MFKKVLSEHSGVKAGPFLDELKIPHNLNPISLLLIGIILSTVITIYHSLGFKEHIDKAENRLEKHLEQLRFAEKFSAIDEALTNAARASMKSYDRQMLALYLEQENRMQELLDQRM